MDDVTTVASSICAFYPDYIWKKGYAAPPPFVLVKDFEKKLKEVKNAPAA